MIKELEALLMRLGQSIRERKNAARSSADSIRIAMEGKDIRGTVTELLLMQAEARAEAFVEVLLLLEEERRRADALK